MRNFKHLPFIAFIAFVIYETDSRDTGKLFELGPTPEEKLVFVPKGIETSKFNLTLGNLNDYALDRNFSLIIAGRKLDIHAYESASRIVFAISANDSFIMGVGEPTNINVTLNGIVFKGTALLERLINTTIQFEEVKEVKGAHYFSIKLTGNVPPNFVIKGNDTNEYTIGDLLSETTTFAYKGRGTVAIWSILVLAIEFILLKTLST